MRHIIRVVPLLSILFLPSTAAAQAFLGAWGSFGPGVGELKYPYGIVAGPQGDLYVTDQHNFRIVRYSNTGQVISMWGSEGSAPGQFGINIGLGADAGGNVYVADWGNNRVQVFDANGVFLRRWVGSGVRDVAVGPNGRVYVASDFGWVTAYTPQGQPLFSVGQGQFTRPSSIAIDSDGNVYVADLGFYSREQNISKWSAEGAFLARWTRGGPGSGPLGGPSGLAIDALGNVWVAEYGENRIEVFEPSGALIHSWGSPGTGAGQFDQAVDIAIDAASHVYVVDMLNHRIQKFAISNPVATHAISWGGLKRTYRD